MSKVGVTKGAWGKVHVSRMLRALIREFSVVGFTPSNAAAPFGP